uniref:Uncharacterized protein n=1 Tax=Angiostrongylus cantonensis TaxID=6313 RepID=A0A0K0CWC6_ANGCA
MNRAILSLFRQQRPLLRRALHKGVESTPPMRYTSNAECVSSSFSSLILLFGVPLSFERLS